MMLHLRTPLFILFTANLWPTLLPACGIPKDFDVHTLRYKLEKLALSATVEVDFPQLSNLKCDEEKTAFGTLWTFDLLPTEEIQFQVKDRDGVTVQKTTLGGKIQLKVTSTWASLFLFDAKWSTPLLDHDLKKAELWSSGKMFATPAIEVTDQGVSRRLQLEVIRY